MSFWMKCFLLFMQWGIYGGIQKKYDSDGEFADFCMILLSVVILFV